MPGLYAELKNKTFQLCLENDLLGEKIVIRARTKVFPLRLLDLDPDNMGREKFGVIVEGPEATGEAVGWADLLLVTGTTLANNAIGRFLTGKPVIFYGTTIAGPACLMGWDRFCARSE